MSTSTFGLTLLVVGMGGTLASLYLITLLIRAITVLFPGEKPKQNDASK